MKEINIPYLTGLVIRARQSDSDAFAELYAMTYNKVYNYARHYLKDVNLAEDAMQEIYILALRNLSKLNDPTLFIAWLNRISFHVCYDISQKLKANSGCVYDLSILEIIKDDHPYSNPEDSYQKKEEANHLSQALEQLPFHEKQVLVMRFFNNMKLEEIADAMDISRSSVKRYIASGQNALKNLMKE